MNSLPRTVTRQRRGCDLNPGPTAPKSTRRRIRSIFGRADVALTPAEAAASQRNGVDTIWRRWNDVHVAHHPPNTTLSPSTRDARC